MRSRALGMSLVMLVLPACLLTIDDSLVDRRDASVDAAAIDAASDARNEAGNDAASGCPVGALFCEDFESGAFAKWTVSSDFANYGSVVANPTDAATKSLRVVAPSNTTEWSSHLTTAVTLPTTGDVRVAYSMYVTASTAELIPFGLRLSDAELGYRFGIPAKFFEQGGAPFAVYDVPAIASGRWVPVKVVLRRQDGAAEITVDGTTARAPVTGKLGAASKLGATTLYLIVGIFDAAQKATFSGWIDDIVVTTL